MSNLNNERGLKALVEELKEFIEDQNRVIRALVNHDDIMGSATQQLAEAQAKVEEFKGVFERQQLLIAEGMNYTTDLQAKVDRLETKVKALVRVAQDSSYGRHYLRTHYPALKQEKSDE